MIQREGIEAVAVCLLHAYINPAHELRIREVLQAACPGLSVALSHEIAREWREYERASSAVLNAYVAPRVERYLSNLEAELAQRAVPAQSSTSCSATAVSRPLLAHASSRFRRFSPVRSAGRSAGAARSRQTGRPNLLCVDMGGTSFDLA